MCVGVGVGARSHTGRALDSLDVDGVTHFFGRIRKL